MSTIGECKLGKKAKSKGVYLSAEPRGKKTGARSEPYGLRKSTSNKEYEQKALKIESLMRQVRRIQGDPYLAKMEGRDKSMAAKARGAHRRKSGPTKKRPKY